MGIQPDMILRHPEARTGSDAILTPRSNLLAIAKSPALFR